MIARCWGILRHDVLLLLRQPWNILLLLVFLLMTATLASFGLGPDPAALALVGPTILWVGLLLAALLGAEQLFRHDDQDSTLDMLALCPMPLSLVFLLRCVAHWLATGLPLALVAPVVGMMLGVSGPVIWSLVPGFWLGTPILTLLTALAAALGLNSQRGLGLLALLVLPFTVPVIIFANGSVLMIRQGLADQGVWMMLAGLLVLALTLIPLAGGAALRLATRF